MIELEHVIASVAWLSAGVLTFIGLMNVVAHTRYALLIRWVSTFSLAGMFLISTPHAARGLDPWASGDATQQSIPLQTVPASEVPSPPELTREEYIVVPGDNLWTIAQSHVRGNESVEHLWRQIVKDNSHTIRSGNPNLIYPGETIAINNEN